MSRFRQDPGCERAGEWASLELDHELSQIERVLLKAHLRRCGECAVAVGEMRAITASLRAAPLEAPVRAVELPARRRGAQRGLGFRVLFATSLAAAAASLGVFAGSISGTPARHAAPARAQYAYNTAFNQNLDMPQLRTHLPKKLPQRLYPYGRQGGV